MTENEVITLWFNEQYGKASKSDSPYEDLEEKYFGLENLRVHDYSFTDLILAIMSCASVDELRPELDIVVSRLISVGRLDAVDDLMTRYQNVTRDHCSEFGYVAVETLCGKIRRVG